MGVKRMRPARIRNIGLCAILWTCLTVAAFLYGDKGQTAASAAATGSLVTLWSLGYVVNQQLARDAKNNTQQLARDAKKNARPMMHYWPRNGGFACGVDSGFRSSTQSEVTCIQCKKYLGIVK